MNSNSWKLNSLLLAYPDIEITELNQNSLDLSQKNFKQKDRFNVIKLTIKEPIANTGW